MQALLHQQRAAWGRHQPAASTSGSSFGHHQPLHHSERRDRPSAFANQQAQRFRDEYQPERSSLPQEHWLTWPLPNEGVSQAAQDPAAAAAGHVISLEAHEGRDRPLPEELWQSQAPFGSVEARNPRAQRSRVQRMPVQLPFSFPGIEYWNVELLHNYSRQWPSIGRDAKGRLQLRLGMLAGLDDPQLVPFFFYRGLERVMYSWSDRAFQAAFAALYLGAHLAAISWLYSHQPSLAAAVALNWTLGSLSVAKCALLLLLAASGRVWLYWVYLAGKMVDRVLEKLAPPLRRFFWANFIVWGLFVLLSPTHIYPLPFWPFAPGSMGVHEAFQ